MMAWPALRGQPTRAGPSREREWTDDFGRRNHMPASLACKGAL